PTESRCSASSTANLPPTPQPMPAPGPCGTGGDLEGSCARANDFAVVGGVRRAPPRVERLTPVLRWHRVNLRESRALPPAAKDSWLVAKQNRLPAGAGRRPLRGVGGFRPRRRDCRTA